jgi:hypothetical protein
MRQRNVTASFEDYEAAQSAAAEMERAGFGDVQVRVLPPRTTLGADWREQEILVSVLVSSEHAGVAERVLAGSGGAIEMDGGARWGGPHWDERRGGFTGAQRDEHRSPRPAPRRYETYRPRREEAPETAPWGAMGAAALAVLTGLAFWGGAQWLRADRGARDYPPGVPGGRRFRAGRFQSNLENEPVSYEPPSRSPSYPDGRPARARDLARAP